MIHESGNSFFISHDIKHNKCNAFAEKSFQQFFKLLFLLFMLRGGWKGEMGMICEVGDVSYKRQPISNFVSE